MRKSLLSLLLAVPLFTYAQANLDFKINGHLKEKGIKKVYIVRKVGYRDIVDSADVVDGVYNLKGQTATGDLMSLQTYIRPGSSDQNNAFIRIFIAPGRYEIWHGDTFDNYKSVAKNEDGYQKLKEMLRPYQIKIDSLSKIIRADAFGETGSKAKLELHSVNQERYEKGYAGFMLKDPLSPAAFYALKEYARSIDHPDLNTLKRYFEMLRPSVRESDDGRIFIRKILSDINFNTAGAIGAIAPEFSLPDTAGREIHLADFRGKYVLVDFWASWCGPCRADNPHLVNAYNQYHQKGFEILSVSMDVRQRAQAWLAAIRKDHIGSWTHVADMKENERMDGLESTTNPAALVFGVTGIPQNFLLDPTGKIIGRGLRNGDLESTLKSILNK